MRGDERYAAGHRSTEHRSPQENHQQYAFRLLGAAKDVAHQRRAYLVFEAKVASMPHMTDYAVRQAVEEALQETRDA